MTLDNNSCSLIADRGGTEGWLIWTGSGLLHKVELKYRFMLFHLQPPHPLLWKVSLECRRKHEWEGATTSPVYMQQLLENIIPESVSDEETLRCDAASGFPVRTPFCEAAPLGRLPKENRRESWEKLLPLKELLRKKIPGGPNLRVLRSQASFLETRFWRSWLSFSYRCPDWLFRLFSAFLI